MKKSQLAQILQVPEDEISKALNALNVDRNKRDELSSSISFKVEALIKLVNEKKISYKLALQELNTEQSSLPKDTAFITDKLPPEVLAQIQAAVVKAVPAVEGDMTETLRRRREAVRQMFIQLIDQNYIKQLKALDGDKIRAELSEPLTVEVLEGKPTPTLPSGEAG